jgi:anti-sigma B factor antagonist
MPNSADRFPRSDAVGGAFEISHQDVDRRTCVVSPEGEIDLASAPTLRARLLDCERSGYSKFILDFSLVEHIDSTGLGVLIGLKKRLGDEGVLAIAAVPRAVFSVFEITGLDTRLEIFATLEQALVYMREVSVPVPGSC